MPAAPSLSLSLYQACHGNLGGTTVSNFPRLVGPLSLSLSLPGKRCRCRVVQPHTTRANALLRFMERTIPFPVRGKELSCTNLERLTRFVSADTQASNVPKYAKQANKLSPAPVGQASPPGMKRQFWLEKKRGLGAVWPRSVSLSLSLKNMKCYREGGEVSGNNSGFWEMLPATRGNRRKHPPLVTIYSAGP